MIDHMQIEYNRLFELNKQKEKGFQYSFIYNSSLLKNIFFTSFLINL